MATLLDLCQPSERLVEHYKKKTAAWKTKVKDLISEVNDCKIICTQYADAEVQLQKKEVEIASLNEELDNLRRCLFSEKVHVMKLVEDKDRLRLELLDSRRTFKTVLEVLGLKECEVASFLEEPKSNKIKDIIKSNRIKRGVKQILDLGIDPDMKISKLNEDLQAAKLQTKLLESQLEEQHCLFKEELDNLLEERRKLVEERKEDRKRLQHKISCLNCRLESTRKQICNKLHSKLIKEGEDIGSNVKLMLENEKLMKCLIICKEMLGEDFPSDLDETKPIKLKEEIRNLQRNLSGKLLDIQQLKTQTNCLRIQINNMEDEKEEMKEKFKKEKERMMEKCDWLNKRYEKEHKRRVNDSVGFRNDIKLLRSNLQSLERQIRLREIRKRSGYGSDDKENDDLNPVKEKCLLKKDGTTKEKGILKKSKSR